MRARSSGFTLLEVMVAIAILGLGLTVILSSQAGLLASVQRVRNETYAANLMRCRMAEVEQELSEEGFSLLDQNDSGECCEDEDEPGFSCEWRIETVELPQPASFDDTGEGESGDDSSDVESPQGLGSILSQPGGLGSVDSSSPDALAGAIGGSMPGGEGGIIQMALTMVYPSLKPMLEASIRKVTVKVKWDEGRKVRDFSAVQYITNPVEGALNPNADEGLEELQNLLEPEEP